MGLSSTFLMEGEAEAAIELFLRIGDSFFFFSMSCFTIKQINLLFYQ